MNKKNILFFCVLLCVAISCTQTESILDKHESVQIKINTSDGTRPLSLNDYSVDSVRSLSFPDGKTLYDISKFMVKKNRIYILDTRCAHTVFVFDYSGSYLFNLGERGRAKHEYTNEPTDFFVDNMSNTHVFDRNGQKVISFTKKGEVFRVVFTGNHFPHSFGLTNNNRYAYCRADESEKNLKPALMFCDWNDDNQKVILPFENSYCFHPSNRTFFSNGQRLSHIPILSDSVLVFNNDSLEKVVHFDFGGKFVTEEIPDAVRDVNKVSDLARYNGVLALHEYQETDDLIYLKYTYNLTVMRWLYNKRTKKTINTAKVFEGVDPFVEYYLRDKQIIALVDQNIVDELKEFSDKEGLKNDLLLSAPQMKDLIEGKIKMPALFYISLK